MKNPKFFQWMAISIFSAFMGLMIIVTVVAFSRQSGHTGLDMGKIQKLRHSTLETSPS